MLRRSLRLRASEVRDIIKQGRSARLGSVSAKILPADGRSRVAVVVSKTVAGTAVARNRLRRVAYRVLRASLPPHGVEAVVFVKKNDPRTLPAEIASLCSKLI